MAMSVESELGISSKKGLLRTEQVKLYLSSKTSFEDRRILFDTAVPVNALVKFSSYFCDALEGITEVSDSSGPENLKVVSKFGPDQHGKEVLSAPAHVIPAAGGPAIITIIGGDALVERAFKTIIRWMLDSNQSGQAEEISDKLKLKLNFTDLLHCMGVAEVLGAAITLKYQLYDLLTKIADDQVPIDDIKALYDHGTVDHPARSLVVESVGKAYLEKRLKNSSTYYQYSERKEEFKKALQAYISNHQASGADWTTNSATVAAQTSGSTTSTVSEWSSEAEATKTEATGLDWSVVPDIMAAASFYTCTNEAFRHSESSYMATPIVSFDGPADEWSTVGGAAAGDQWNAGSADWQDEPVPSGSVNDGWTTSGGGAANNNGGWSEDTGAAGASRDDDDNSCRRCKKPGHFARECPQPRNDNCFNCGQPGHISRDCTEPKKPREDTRACRKCNEVGHIARDCSNGGGGCGGDRVCHKCGEIGHISRECTSSAFGASAGGAGGGMKCYNCQQYGHRSSECTNESVKPEYGSDRRTCNKCSQKGHISRECRETGGNSYTMQHGGGGYGDRYNNGYGGGKDEGHGGGGYDDQHGTGYGNGGYDGQGGLYGAAAESEQPVEPAQGELVNITIDAPIVRKGRKGRPTFLRVTEALYDPHAFEDPINASSYGGGGGYRVRNGDHRGSRSGRGRGGGRGGEGSGRIHNGGDDAGGEFTNENVPPPVAVKVPIIAVEGDWAGAGDADDAPVPAASSGGW